VGVIESVYKDHPNDSRNVTIKYTLAAGDATVAVTPSRPEIAVTEDVYLFSNELIDQYTSLPYQSFGSARAKVSPSPANQFLTEEFGVSLNPLYDRTQPVYMIITVNAGDIAPNPPTVAGYMEHEVNFGSKSFNLGEDASRWCDV
jgi:hypothetical protein